VPPKRGHGQDAPSFNARQGAGRGCRLAHGSAREALGELGRRSTVIRGVLETLRIDGSWARELRRRSPGRAVQARRLGARRCTWLRGFEPPACADARDRTPNRGGANSGGREPQESTDGRPQPGQARGRRGTDSRGEQGFEVGVPAANRRAQCWWERDGTCGAPRVRRGDRTSEREERPSRLMSPGSAFGWARAAKSRRGSGKRS